MPDQNGEWPVESNAGHTAESFVLYNWREDTISDSAVAVTAPKFHKNCHP